MIFLLSKCSCTLRAELTMMRISYSILHFPYSEKEKNPKAKALQRILEQRLYRTFLCFMALLFSFRKILKRIVTIPMERKICPISVKNPRPGQSGNIFSNPILVPRNSSSLTPRNSSSFLKGRKKVQKIQ